LCSKGRIALPPVKWLASLHHTCKKKTTKETKRKETFAMEKKEKKNTFFNE
jgi:hypothetical protein